jgi:SAM-dependent methyltransferase
MSTGGIVTRSSEEMTFDRPYFETRYRSYARQNPARKLEFYRKLAELGVRNHSRPRILDLGCAFGLFLSRLDDSWERFGEDVSAYAIEEARANHPSIGFGVQVEGKHPFTGPFNAITAWDVLEHVVELDGLLKWVHQNLAPGGALIFVVPVYDGPTAPVIRLLDRDPTHVHKRSRRFWLELAGRDFLLEDWWGVYRFLFPAGPYLHLVSHLLRRHAPAIACLMRRR